MNATNPNAAPATHSSPAKTEADKGKTSSAVRKFNGSQDPIEPETNLLLPGQAPSGELLRFMEFQQMADVFSRSGALPADMNAGKAIMLMQYGKSINLDATQSLFRLFFINGRVGTYGEVILENMIQHGYTTEVLERTPKNAKIRVTAPDGRTHEEEFSWEDAERAKLPPLPGSDAAKKSPWILYPQNMLYWKAIANAKRFFCPEVMRGVLIKEDLEGATQIDFTETKGLTPTGKAFQISRPGDEPVTEPTDTPLEPETPLTEDPVAEDEPPEAEVVAEDPAKEPKVTRVAPKKTPAKKIPAKATGKDKLPY